MECGFDFALSSRPLIQNEESVFAPESPMNGSRDPNRVVSDGQAGDQDDQGEQND